MRNIHFIILMVSIIFAITGCGNNEAPVNNDENVSGTVRDNIVVVHDKSELVSEYYGKPGSEEEGKHILIFKKNMHDFKKGTVIVFDRIDTNTLKHGLLRKVESVAENNNTIKIVSSQAALDDVFSDLTLSYSGTLAPGPILKTVEENLGNSEPIRILSQEKGVKLYANSHSIATSSDSNITGDGYGSKLKKDFTLDVNVDMGHGVSLSGSIAFSLNYHMHIKFKRECTKRGRYTHICHKYKTYLDDTYFYIEPEEKGSLTLSAEDDISLNKGKTLGSYSFPPIDLQVGIVPVILVPKLTIKVNAEGKLTAGLSTGFKEDITAKAGLKYKKKKSKWYPIKSKKITFTSIPPTFDASATAKLSVGPELEMKIYDVTGPVANLDAYLRADVDIDANPWWKLYVGIESDATFHMRIVHHTYADITLHIFNYEEDLAKAKGEFE